MEIDLIADQIQWSYIRAAADDFHAGPCDVDLTRYVYEDIVAFGEFITDFDEPGPGALNVALLRTKLGMIPIDASGRENFVDAAAQKLQCEIPLVISPWEGYDHREYVHSRILHPVALRGQPLIEYEQVPDRPGWNGIADRTLRWLSPAGAAKVGRLSGDLQRLLGD